MTGFGRGVAEAARARATIDVRAVNHRFLDLKLRGAPVAPATEEAIGSRVRGSIERGAVTVAIHLVREGGAGIRIDHAAAKVAHEALTELARTLGIAGPELGLVLAQPGVVVISDDERPDDAIVLTALEAALAQLDQMRLTEGAALAKELSARLDELGKIQAAVAERAAAVPDQVQRRLHDRLRRMIDGDDPTRPVPRGKAGEPGWLDPARLAQEVALLAERADVTEELVRLASHLEQARALIAGKAAAGRRLDFLVQEIGRELNTIGSKSSVAEISTAVVEAKAVLEKVREQVQNVE